MNQQTFLQLQNEDSALAERMAYIDFKLRFTGFINRSDLNEMFGLAEAAASKMMTKYTALCPNNMSYNRSLRVNAITDDYSPLINIDAETALGMLANGFNKNKIMDRPMLPYARIGKVANQLDINTVAKITRAMSCGYAISTTYLSENSDYHDERIVVPIALLFDGKNWIFRAFCKKDQTNGQFKNFNFSRATNVIELKDELRKPQEELSQDKMWNTQIPLLLLPHPDRSESEKETIKADFGFNGESKLIVTERAALIWMLEKQWFIDARTNEDIEKDNDDIKKGKKTKPYYKFDLNNKDMVKVVLSSLQ
ncbi:TPA: WYL domain-containing protein [Photobacterium damselae]|uniref:WYL domain-containing protein n=1 Tax=Photobacterium damselae TaxID=38293 RepID=UPI0015A39EBC|nr:WYL domain-containing protein [Photobacterium damselae]NVO60990.1 WYL domain-containing protein [Photobacterium damselae subsp. damselae]